MKLTKDNLGDRMKSYEAVETCRALDPRLPIYARIDGRSFSRFTRGMERPFDRSMSMAMVETMKYLVGNTHARIGYTQSDEISLVWLAEGDGATILFSGKVLKLASVLASMAAAKFASVCPEGYSHRLPHFDCRVFQLPSKEEAANAILWRALDTRKNAISMAAESVFSSKQLHGLGQADRLEKLAAAGIDFEAYPGFFKDGTYARRKTVERFLTEGELRGIPDKHHPLGPVVRTEIETMDTIRMLNVANRVEFIFDGAVAKEDK